LLLLSGSLGVSRSIIGKTSASNLHFFFEIFLHYFGSIALPFRAGNRKANYLFIMALALFSKKIV